MTINNNGPELMSNGGGPSIMSRKGSASFINSNGNASPKGNGIALGNGNLTNGDGGDGTISNQPGPGAGASVGNNLKAPHLDGKFAQSNGSHPYNNRMDRIVNGNHRGLGRARETDELLGAVRELVIPFIQAADDAAEQKHTGKPYVNAAGQEQNVLVDYHEPAALFKKLQLDMPAEGKGKDGLLDTIEAVLKYSVNTWDQGFMDKLFSSNTPVGVISDLVLSVLNTNLHVYQVSPALTTIEKITAKALANMFGFTGPRAGGVNCQGGSSSNLTSMVVARNTLYPDCHIEGNKGHDFVVFTSAHGHYSVEKSAMVCGLGSKAVWPVPVDDVGCMKPAALREMVQRAKDEGRTPFYVNTTAGTTVRGSFEAFEEISAICKEFGLWMHIDGSWGGPVIFSKKQQWKLKGSHLADSITINPHKMLNVPATCSYLLGPDMSIFNKANSTSAGYLFHGHGDGEYWDLADLTLQCGRRADSLKLALAWVYYGSEGFERQIDNGFEVAEHLYNLVKQSPHLQPASEALPACLQICFYYAKDGVMPSDPKENTARTSAIVHRLIARGYMTDYAPSGKGHFFRVVVNCQTQKGTVEGLVKAIEDVGGELY